MAGDCTSARAASARRQGFGFWAVAFAYLTVMAFSAVPSPLYGIYQQRDGFSSFTITLIYAAYALGVVASLLFAGHISDWHGRRRILLPAVVLSIASALIFLVWRDLPGLFLARIVNGLSVGVVAATATAYLAELHSGSRPRASPLRGQVVATTVNVGGLGVGPLLSGFLAQYVRDPLAVPYVVIVVALAVAFVVVASTPETRVRPFPRPRYRPQRVSVPREARGTYFAAGTATFLAFGAMGLFLGLTSTFLVSALHDRSHALAGITIFVVAAGAVVAQTATLTWPLRRLLACGIAGMLAGLALTVGAAWLPTPSLALFLAGGALTGAGGGLVFKGSVATVAAISTPDTRAEVLAGLFLGGYLGLTVPVIGVGISLQYLSPKMTLLVFALAVGAFALAATPRLLAGSTAPSALR
jgi:MFS family permease